MGRKTKIVATYGPAVADPQTLERLLAAGVDVVRMNMSHGEPAEHEKAITDVRRIAARLGRPVAVLLDLRGPKIRLGRLADEPVEVCAGESVFLADGPGAQAPARDERMTVLPVEGYPRLHEDVRPGEPVLLDDGAVRLEAVTPRTDGVECRVLVDGPLSSHKGVNLPATKLVALDIPTEKDWADLDFGLAHGVDWIALSFVRSGADIRRLQQGIAARGAQAPVIAKIEKREALAHLDEILAAADGVMVARGDLGVETELEEVALHQKEIIRACNRAGKVVITATQMLESMVTQASPTRAEVADVSNAIFDGTDAIMLSGETAVGRYPVEAVSYMARIAERTDDAIAKDPCLAERPYLSGVPDAVAHAACVTAQQIGAQALVCLTRSGLTARLVSRYRPQCSIVAASPRAETVRRLALVWGVRPTLFDERPDGHTQAEEALDAARAAGFVKAPGRVVITAGVSTGALRGQTNLVRVEEL